jgi:hypothetical protein
VDTLNTEEVLALATEARSWPTIGALADRYRVNGRAIRKAVANGDLQAVRLNVLRINPASFAAWLDARQP